MFPNGMNDEEFLVLDDDEDDSTQAKPESTSPPSQGSLKVKSTLSSVGSSISNAFAGIREKMSSIGKKKKLQMNPIKSWKPTIVVMMELVRLKIK